MFAGPGEVRRLARSIDWSATPLGPVGQWSPALRNIVRTALDSPFPMNLWCGNELVLIYNDAYAPVLGAKHPAALGSRGSTVWQEIWPEIAPMFEQIRNGGPAVYADDAPFLVQRSEGDRDVHEPNAWFTFALSPVRDNTGNIIAFLNVVSETTARIQAERALAASEARLREVFTDAPAFLAVLRGEDHVFEYVNTAYYQLVGHRDLVGKPVFDALPEVRGQGFENLLNGVIEKGEPFVGREVPVKVARTKDSLPEERFVDIVYYPITEPDGTRSGVVAHGSDVTEHVLARRAAQRSRIEAERANQAKSLFLANMSHEIRTPINAVMGYADLLDAGVAGELTSLQQEYIARIRASSRHLLSLVNDVLDLSKIEAGEMSVRKEVTALRDVVIQACEMITPDAVNKQINLTQEWDCDVDRVIGDQDRVRQVLINLLSNAVKFTPQGGRVTIRTGVQDRFVAIDVEDNGIGIEPENLETIFEPFVQAERGHTRTVGGTGLGLTISRRFARMMGGDLTVQSTPGSGSIFSLRLVPAR